LLLERLRTLALQKTVLERATAGTIRLRLLKIAALITVSVCRVYVRLASGFALKKLFEHVLRALRASPQRRRSAALLSSLQLPLVRRRGGRCLPANSKQKAQVAFLAPPENPSTSQSEVDAGILNAVTVTHRIKASPMTISRVLPHISSRAV